MIDALKHRGPHDKGINGDSTALFGMTRLAIRSLNGGKQPIVDADSGVMMTCNGEIDNHLELREWLLARGRTVEQNTDVAVIPCLYLELGDAFVERLKGAFAIAIWDPRNKKLLLIRDRAGERPLFFSVNDGTVAFSSLISTLVVSASHTSTINTDAVHRYMQCGFFTSPSTPFADIQKVSPGEVVTIDATGIQRKRYWHWNIGQTAKQSGSLDAFDEIFRESVRRQSEVDVDFGLFLSGGVDSSLTTAVARSIHPASTLKAYSLRFSEASYDEGHYAEQVANSLNVESVPVWVHPDDFPPTLAQLIRQVGEPLADPAWIPRETLNKSCSNHTCQIS
jgi:asparagine synthase (glutamine-hydrolysing)